VGLYALISKLRLERDTVDRWGPWSGSDVNRNLLTGVSAACCATHEHS